MRGWESLRDFVWELGFVMCSGLMSKDLFHGEQMGEKLYPFNLSKMQPLRPSFFTSH
jgi:hypothetical protein